MDCPSCGHANLPGEDECVNCGAALVGSSDEASADLVDSAIERRLGDLGLAQPATIEGTVPVGGALNIMRDGGVDCLLVMARGRLVGIFTERDAVLKLTDRRLTVGAVRRRVTRVLRHARLGTRTLVREVMTPDPVVLHPDETLAVAIHKMAVGGFRHIPVVVDDVPVGVMSAKDVFRQVLELAPDA
ncbi:MAG TPA: CBS domain-containing protein [Candidatus Limnocylindrales bacterium]|nr:CBS domain-containing protein [Candidatus Limnocylindrales bacterium]